MRMNVGLWSRDGQSVGVNSRREEEEEGGLGAGPFFSFGGWCWRLCFLGVGLCITYRRFFWEVISNTTYHIY